MSDGAFFLGLMLERGGGEGKNSPYVRRTRAALRMACRVSGFKQKRLGLGLLGLGAAMSGVVFSAPTANANELGLSSGRWVIDGNVAPYDTWREGVDIWRFTVGGSASDPSAVMVIQGGVIINATNPPSENLAATNNVGSIAGGSLNILGPETDVSAGNYFFIGVRADETGQIVVSDGAMLQSSQVRVGHRGDGSFIASGAGTRWITRGDGANSYVVVGANTGSNGSLLVTDGAVAEVESFLSIGGAGTGRATISENATVTTQSELRVGMGGTGDGALTIESGGRVNANFAYIGNGGVGTVSVDGAASRLAVTDELFLGGGTIGVGARNGTLDVLNGGLVTAKKLHVGFSGTGAVLVAGRGSQLRVEDEIILGENAGSVGTMSVNPGGLVSTDVALVGGAGKGRIDVAGPGSQFLVNDTGYLANAAGSEGRLNVTDGAAASFATIHAGYRGDGAIDIGGPGSGLTVTDTMYVGTYGGATGLVSVHDGASLTTNRAVIAESGLGMVSVAGAGSTWTIAEELILGSATGSGTLDIGNDALVVADTISFGEGDAAGKGAIHVGGAVLAVGQVQRNGGASADLLIDGGTLTIIRDQDALFDGMGADDVTFGLSGATFDTQSFDVRTVAQLNGAGSFTKLGSGTLTLGELAAYAGDTEVIEGTLAAGGANLFSSASAYSTGPDGTLLLNGFDQTVNAVDNSGTIRFGGMSAGTLLTVTGNYEGTGGRLEFNTVLGDDASATDMLVVRGDTSGNSLVRVNNVGGTGAETTGDGIRIIRVDGSSAADAFVLAGPAIAGAYGYELFQNGISDPTDGDWYLRSAGLAPTVPVYENYPQVLLGMVELPTLRQRVGNRHWAAMTGAGFANGAIENGIWTRIEGAYSHVEAGASTADVSYDADTWLVQVGLDGQFYEGATGRLIGGLTAQYARSSADIFSRLGDGDNTTDSYGIGATLTWYGETGLYVDAQAHMATLRSDLSAAGVGAIGDGIHGSGYALSLETGQRIALDGAWSLTPQAQLAYGSVDFDAFTDPFGARVSLQKGDSLKGRLGAALNYDDATADSQVYGIANLTYEFLDGTSVAVSGIDLAFEPQRFGGEAGIGGSYNWAGGQYSLHGEALASTSFEGSYGFKGTIGFTAGF